MKHYLARLGKLLLVLVLFVSPFFVISRFLSAHQPSTDPVLVDPLKPITFETQNRLQPKESKFAVLIAQDSPQKTLSVQATSETTPEEVKKISGTYTVAVLGDSMIDVMQPGLPQLETALRKFYPQAQFKLLNYGVGATDIDYGLTRLSSGYTYLGQTLPSLLSQNPDVIVIESFAYNHWGNNQTDLDRQWLTLAKIVETIKNQSQAKIILASTVGPDENTLCDGIEGISLLPNQKQEKAATIRAYLQNIINFATSQNYPLADAYHPSLDNHGNGQPVYINTGDHLHPSGPGGELFAQKVAEAIYKNNLL